MVQELLFTSKTTLPVVLIVISPLKHLKLKLLWINFTHNFIKLTIGVMYRHPVYDKDSIDKLLALEGFATLPQVMAKTLNEFFADIGSKMVKTIRNIDAATDNQQLQINRLFFLL